MYFHYFVIISSKEGLFIWTNLNPLYQKMLCVNFDWNLPCSSGEEEENGYSLGQSQTTDKLWSDKITSAFGSSELESLY